MWAVNLLRRGPILLDIVTLKIDVWFIPAMFIFMHPNSALCLSYFLGILSDVHYALATPSKLRCYNSALFQSNSLCISATGIFLSRS